MARCSRKTQPSNGNAETAGTSSKEMRRLKNALSALTPEPILKSGAKTTSPLFFFHVKTGISPFKALIRSSHSKIVGYVCCCSGAE